MVRLNRAILVILLALALVVSGCGNKSGSKGASDSTTAGNRVEQFFKDFLTGSVNSVSGYFSQSVTWIDSSGSIVLTPGEMQEMYNEWKGIIDTLKVEAPGISFTVVLSGKTVDVTDNTATVAAILKFTISGIPGQGNGILQGGVSVELIKNNNTWYITKIDWGHFWD